MSPLRLALITVVLVAAGCQQPVSPSPPPPTPDVASPVIGVVVSVDAAGLGDIRAFTLRPTDSPSSFGFVVGDLENPTEFPPSHLAEHQATSQPVRVFFRSENGIHTAYRLEDAIPGAYLTTSSAAVSSASPKISSNLPWTVPSRSTT